MDITVDKNVFLKALSHAQKAVEKRNTIPILSHVKMDASVDGLTLSATDMELMVTETVAAKVNKPGVVTAPAVQLFQMANKLPGGADVHLASAEDDKLLHLTCGQTKFKLPLLPADEFPVMDEEEFDMQFSLSDEHLRKLLHKTSFAMSREETRYYLNGVYWHSRDSDKRLAAVATDGHRLAKAEIDAPKGFKCADGVIIPRKAVTEVKDLLSEVEGTVDISLSASKIRFSLGSVVLLSKLVDGTFPDYERVIPADNDLVMRVGGKDFREVVDRMATISSERGFGVKLCLREGSDLKVSAESSGSSGEEDLSVEYSGKDLDVGFNAQYLDDICDQVSAGSLEIAFSDASAPALMTDSDDEDVLFVLMPMRV